MTTELTPERLAEIEREAEERYPDNGSTIGQVIVLGQREGYIAAAVPCELLLEQEREKVKGLVECLKKVSELPFSDTARKRVIETELNKYKSI